MAENTPSGKRSTPKTKKPLKGRNEIMDKVNKKIATHRGGTENELRTQVNRSISNGTSGRGDRRDMNATYTGNKKHAARGNTPRANVATRKD